MNFLIFCAVCVLLYAAITSLIFWQIVAVAVLGLLYFLSPEFRTIALFCFGLFLLAVFGGLG
jgi:predicted membrane protein